MVLDLPFGVAAMLMGMAEIPHRRAVVAGEGNRIAGIKRIGTECTDVSTEVRTIPRAWIRMRIIPLLLNLLICQLSAQIHSAIHLSDVLPVRKAFSTSNHKTIQTLYRSQQTRRMYGREVGARERPERQFRRKAVIL